MIRMRSYLEHLVIGTAAVVTGLGILYGIILEMTTAYHEPSRHAYLWGLVACGTLIVTGIIYIFRAVYMNRRIFKSLSTEERRLFYQELNQATTLFFDSRLIITQHYVVAYARAWRAHIHIFRMDDLVACFGRSVYGSTSEPDSYHLTIFDKNFKRTECVLKGEKAAIMDKGYQALLSLSPWVFSDNYEDFRDNYKRKSREKAYLKEIELRRRETDLSDETLPLEVITAADIIRQFNEKQKEKAKASSVIKDSAKAFLHKKD